MPPPPPPWDVALEDEHSKLKVRADLELLKTDKSIIALSSSFVNFDMAVTVKKLDATRDPVNPSLYHYTWEAMDDREWDQNIMIIGPTPADYLLELDALSGNWKVAELLAHEKFRTALIVFLRAYEIKTLDYDRK